MKTSITEKDGRFLVTVSGELDTLAAEPFKESLAPLAERIPESIQVDMDLDGVNYIASKCLRVFLQFYQDVAASGGSVKVVAIQDTVREVFDLTGFTKIFSVE